MDLGYGMFTVPVPARGLNDHRLVIPISRLHDVESKAGTPNTYQLCKLAHVYEFDLRDVLVLYGVPQR